MRKVVLANNEVITNCTDATTCNEILVVRDTYEKAGAVRDLFTKENSKRIVVKDENDEVVTIGTDLILLDGATITTYNEDVICCIKTRVKTETEKMQDEIAELQEVVIEG